MVAIVGVVASCDWLEGALFQAYEAPVTIVCFLFLSLFPSLRFSAP